MGLDYCSFEGYNCIEAYTIISLSKCYNILHLYESQQLEFKYIKICIEYVHMIYKKSIKYNMDYNI